MGHAGTRLLVDLADATGLSEAVSDALAPLRQRASGHDAGRIALDLAVTLADGGEAIADLAVLRGQPDLFGSVASDPTAWRLLAALDDDALAALRTARAGAREVAWAQAAETGRTLCSTVAGFTIPGLVLDVDATIVVCHSEKESAAKTWKRTFGYHPLLCFLDATGEALAGILRPGNAGSNTAADHIAVVDAALAQIPDAHRYGVDILIRSDSAGASTAFLAHLRGLREQGVRSFFSIGVAITEPIREATLACLDWQPALDGDGELRSPASPPCHNPPVERSPPPSTRESGEYRLAAGPAPCPSADDPPTASRRDQILSSGSLTESLGLEIKSQAKSVIIPSAARDASFLSGPGGLHSH